MKKILYIRSAPYQMNVNAYNSQEIGLAVAFAKKNIECDIIYYHKKDNFDQTLSIDGYNIQILWRKGIRVLRSGIYPEVLNGKFLQQYDAVIASEYSQIMSVLLGVKHENVYIYNGPYYNLFKIPFIEPFYDRAFKSLINKNTKKIFCKTEMSKTFLEKKGFINCSVVGVGLDINKYEKEIEVEHETQELIDKMYGHRNLLYVGSISRRKNVALIFSAFNKIKEDFSYSDLQLVVIGKNENNYLETCKDIIEPQAKKDIIYKDFVKNAQLKFIYDKADIFLLPSKQEIFGMVLLEAMYFGTAVISSHNAGAETLIKNGRNGMIIEQFDVCSWKAAIEDLLNNKELAISMGQAASKAIKKDFLWESIVEKMIQYMR